MTVQHVLTLALMSAAAAATGASAFTPSDGLISSEQRLLALTDARIVVEPGLIIDHATLVIDGDRIAAVGTKLDIPAGATVFDLDGRMVVAGFVELDSQIGLGKYRSLPPLATPTALHTSRGQPGVRHHNRRVLPERDSAQLFEADVDALRKLADAGFTSVQIAPGSGVLRGQAALLATLATAEHEDLLRRARTAQVAAFEYSFWPSDEYPGSKMGAIALLRQTLADARWQARSGAGNGDVGALLAPHPALAALADVVARRQPMVFRADDELDYGRIAAIVEEAGVDAYVIGSGHEYRLPEVVARHRLPLVVPLKQPEVPKVDEPEVAIDVELSTLEHWQAAAAGAARVSAAGAEIALSAAGIEKAAEIHDAIRAAVRAGLTESQALAALTTTPARLVGASSTIGKLKAGYSADLLVVDQDFFRAGDAQLYRVCVRGQCRELKPLIEPEFSGRYALRFAGGQEITLELSGRGATRTLTIGERKFKAAVKQQQLESFVAGDVLGLGPSSARLVLGADGDPLRGTLEHEGRGQTLTLTGLDEESLISAARASAGPAAAAEPAAHRYPAGMLGRAALTAAEEFVIDNVTLWTQVPGAQPQADSAIHVRDGRIVALGSSVRSRPGVKRIDGRGQHLTPGLIDPHSHTAISGNVNEPSHAVTAEVRIGDVLDPTDIGLYQQLAGGLTTAHLMHGSANPVGGQGQTIKLRWGTDAEGLKFVGARSTIKFALGENVKQSNRGEAFRLRYPQTRMGVEQTLIDAFAQAERYAAALRARRRGQPELRRDLRLEALAEVLANQRQVHVHSYRQDEVLMFARMAKHRGLRDVVFQHILEGYKVADAIVEAGAMGSGFSDWWGFKVEVSDAIPHNGALMQQVGVLSSFNSDSEEMARRMNVEAAKAVKYGGLSEPEALAFVTRNAAIQLGVADRVGTLEVGKDADLVLWSDHPLSTQAVAVQTFIDGRLYFDRAADARAAQADRERRQQLIELALAERLKARQLGEGDATPTPAEADDPERVALRQRRDRWLAMLRARGQVFHPGFAADYSAGRGLYHDGGVVNACSMQDKHY